MPHVLRNSFSPLLERFVGRLASSLFQSLVRRDDTH